MDRDEEINKHIPLRMNLFFFVVFVVFSILIFRLAVMQIAEGKSYAEKANSQETRKLPLAPIRGNIVDRNGVIIAKTVPSYSVIFNEDGLSREQILSLAKRLSVLFKMPAADILTAMDVGFDLQGNEVSRKQSKFLPKKIKSNANEKEIAVLTEQSQIYRGIDLILDPARSYSANRTAVQLVGYIKQYSSAGSLSKYKNKDDVYLPWETVGYDGIEYLYQDELRGQNGYKEVIVNAQGKMIKEKNEVAPKQGNTLVLSLDARMQEETEQKIDQQLKYLRTEAPGRLRAPNAKTAYAVAMEVDTGKVVTMVSFPDYDPNVWNNPIDDKTYKDIQFSYLNGAIRNAPYDARPLPFIEHLKHPGSMIYMGSTQKPLTVAIGLNEKVISPNDRWVDPGRYYFGKGNAYSVGNSEGEKVGLLSPERAIALSINTYMARIGNTMALTVKNSVDKFQKYLHEFGLGVKPGSGLPYETSGEEEYLTAYDKYGAQSALIQSSFGQAQRFSALQLAQYTGTLATGQRMKPLLVDEIKNPQGIVTKTFKPEVLNTVDIPKKYLDVSRRGMEQVVQYGTARYVMGGLPYPVAAKTGTSEQDIYVENKSTKKWYLDRRVNNAVFIAYAPADKPKIAIAVIVPEGGFGAVGAGPIARSMLESYDKYFGMYDKVKP